MVTPGTEDGGADDKGERGRSRNRLRLVDGKRMMERECRQYSRSYTADDADSPEDKIPADTQ